MYLACAHRSSISSSYFYTVSDYYYPIVDEVDRVAAEPDPENSNLVGMLVTTVYWRETIRNILAEGSKGIDIVFENPCGADSFTYRLDGPKETYRGTGDLHEDKYNHLGIHSPLLELDSFSKTGSKYSGAPVDKEFCPYAIHVYPSAEMANLYETNNGLIFALSSVAIFLLTSCKYRLHSFAEE